MSRKYLPVNREKPMFLPLDMQSWVPKDHFVWFLVEVAGQLDTSALQAGTSPGRGRPGYDPQMLATLVMYAMSCGVRSSREIEDRTRTDAGFRVASGNQFPDHSTWAASHFPDSFICVISCCELPVQVLVVGFLRSPVTECRVETLAIIADLDVPGNVLPCFLSRRVRGPVHPLDLHRRVK